MLTEIYDFKMIGREKRFSTRLPESFIGVLVSSLGKLGVTILDIHDENDEIIVTTSLMEVRMTGSWSANDLKRKLRNEYYGFLNKRFDERVKFLQDKGYTYYKQYTCYAVSEISAKNGSGIPLGVIMHQTDFLFYYNFE